MANLLSCIRRFGCSHWVRLYGFCSRMKVFATCHDVHAARLFVKEYSYTRMLILWTILRVNKIAIHSRYIIKTLLVWKINILIRAGVGVTMRLNPLNAA